MVQQFSDLSGKNEPRGKPPVFSETFSAERPVPLGCPLDKRVFHTNWQRLSSCEEVAGVVHDSLVGVFHH